MLGAFGPGDHLIGFVFSFLGRRPGGPLYLRSVTMGVLPQWRGQGVATQLKRAQRDRALEAGLSLITWTFDPLESANARLNLHSLGVVCRSYCRNAYGGHYGRLFRGLPTDRLFAEWWIEDTESTGSESQQGADPVFEIEGGRVRRFRAGLDAPCLWMEIPTNIQTIKQDDLDLALDWRLRVREALETYLRRGYLVTDFTVIGQGDARRNGHVLTLASGVNRNAEGDIPSQKGTT